MYYPSSENKGADQLRGYREADLRLCFRMGKNPVFSRCGSLDSLPKRILKHKNCSGTPFISLLGKKVQVGNEQEMAQPERNSHSKNQGGKKRAELTIRYLY